MNLSHKLYDLVLSIEAGSQNTVPRSVSSYTSYFEEEFLAIYVRKKNFLHSACKMA